MAADTQSIFDRLSQTDGFHPGTVESFTDWTVQAGDVVTIESDGVSRKMPVYNVGLIWKGSPQVTLESTGNQKRDEISKKTKSSRASYGRTSANTEDTASLMASVYDEKTGLAATAGVAASAKVTADGAVSSYASLSATVGDHTAELAFCVTKDSKGNYTTAAGLKADLVTITGDVLVDGTLSGKVISSGGLSGDYITATKSLVMLAYGGTSVDASLHHHKLTGSIDDDGTVTLGIDYVVIPDSTEDTYSFNIADTKKCKALVSAAQTKGKDEGISAAVLGLTTVGDVIYSDVSDTEKDVSQFVYYTKSDGTTVNKQITINAIDAYNAGKSAGSGGKLTINDVVYSPGDTLPDLYTRNSGTSMSRNSVTLKPGSDNYARAIIQTSSDGGNSWSYYTTIASAVQADSTATKTYYILGSALRTSSYTGGTYYKAPQATITYE